MKEITDNEEDGICPGRGRVVARLLDFELPAYEWAL
jgi:hypothetical protein